MQQTLKGNSTNGEVTSTAIGLTARSTIKRQSSLPRWLPGGPSPSRLSIRQSHWPLKGPLPPGAKRPPLTGHRDCLQNL